MKARCVVIGLDGASWSLLERWVNEGDLPNIARLCKEGSFARLKSTLPLGTAAAWSSIITGKNPANHGVFEFMTRERDGYDLVSVNSTNRRAKDLWEVVSQAGGRVCVFNVPFTYPPQKVNGILVSGLMTPHSAQDYTYPRSLQRFLRERGYRLYARKTFAPGREEEFLQELHETLEIRIDLALDLFDEEAWDFFMAVFSETDMVQHAFWECIDSNHPSFAEERRRTFEDAILGVYSKLDRMIGVLMEKARDEGNIVLVSDHGAGPLYTWVSINHLLIRLGYLRLRNDLPTLAKRGLYHLGFCPVEMYRLLAALGFGGVRQRIARGFQHKLLDKVFLGLSSVDWDRTLAYCTMGAGQVFLNVKGREPEGVVEPGREYLKIRDRLIYDLREAMDYNGRPVFEVVASRDDFYGDGVFLEEAPDVVAMPNNGLGIFPEYSFGVRSTFSRPFGISGTHSLFGVLALWGSSFKRAREIQNASLIDVAPTILAAMGVPIPNDLDGRVLEETLRSRAIPVYAKSTPKENKSQCVYSKDEEEQLKDHLKTLGYL